MNLYTAISLYAGGPGSGCNPDVGKCGRPRGSGSGEDNHLSLIHSLPDGGKPGTKFMHNLKKQYKDNSDFRVLSDGLSYFTQGAFDEIQNAGKAIDKGEEKQWAKDSMSRGWGKGTLWIGAITTIKDVTGKEIEKARITVDDALKYARSIKEAIDNAPMQERTIFRGLAFSQNQTLTDKELEKRLARDRSFSPEGAQHLKHMHESYRRQREQGTFQQWANLKPGDTVNLQGPQSFTYNDEEALKFAYGVGGKKGVGLRSGIHSYKGVIIEVRGKSRGINTAAWSPWRQKEFLTSGKFKVVKVIPISNERGYGKNRHFDPMRVVLEQI